MEIRDIHDEVIPLAIRGNFVSPTSPNRYRVAIFTSRKKAGWQAIATLPL